MKLNLTNSLKNLFKPVDLTTGKPYKQIIIFMLPILISYVFQQVYTISDAAIVGKYLSAPEVSGVNVVYSLIFIVLQFAFGCSSGFSVISSNYAGEKNEEGIRKSFATQIFLSLIISIILTISRGRSINILKYIIRICSYSLNYLFITYILTSI